jgi:hypothetical protein
MDERLLIPATPELLDGWCGPVVVEHSSGRWLWDGEDECLVDADGELHTPDMYGDRDGVVLGVGTADVRALMLDLARAECRDRVARVLADAAVGPGGHTSGSEWGCQWGRHGGGSWLLNGVGDLRFADEPGSDDAIHVPALADLDPNDDTRLPDGSRLVDALALAAVAREVLT